MNQSRFGTDERAVSEVIGVILMVAITVLLAAVVGAVLLGTPNEQPVPQAAFSYEYDRTAGTVTVTHEGGDTYTPANTGALQVIVDGTGTDWGAAPWQSVAPVSAGKSHTVAAGSGDEIQVVWVGPDGGKAQILGRYTVP